MHTLVPNFEAIELGESTHARTDASFQPRVHALCQLTV
jgi:hypothetical protein